MQTEWTMARDELAAAVKSLGFPKELADIIAKNLGSPKAIRRMTSYLCYVKPKKEEIIIDEMLAIMIELFSRKPGYHLEVEEGIIPIHIDDDTSSLSA